MGKGGGGSSKAGDRQLAAFSKEIQTVSQPARTAWFNQLTEALTTGGVQARIPQAQQAIEQSKAASAAAARQTESDLSSIGLARTPMGQSILATQRTQAAMGAAAAGRIPVDQLIASAPNAILGAAQTATAGLSASATNQAQLGAAQAVAAGQTNAAVGAAAGGTAAAAGTIIAAYI